MFQKVNVNLKEVGMIKAYQDQLWYSTKDGKLFRYPDKLMAEDMDSQTFWLLEGAIAYPSIQGVFHYHSNDGSVNIVKENRSWCPYTFDGRTAVLIKTLFQPGPIYYTIELELYDMVSDQVIKRLPKLYNIYVVIREGNLLIGYDYDRRLKRRKLVCYDLDTDTVCWQFDAEPYLDFTEGHSNFKAQVSAIRGVWRGHVYIFTSIGVLELDAQTGELTRKWIDLDEEQWWRWRPHMALMKYLTASGNSFYDEKLGKIIGLSLLYWEIDLDSGELKVVNNVAPFDQHRLTPYFDSHLIWNDDYIVFGSSYDFGVPVYGLAALNRHTLAIDWVHHYDDYQGISMRLPAGTVNRFAQYDAEGNLYLFEKV